mmetsp:Transcript_142558/g.443350  ORF Transcript_142558/g.443350 Transcript_142558/m.443350 type:complete len:226 (-) Transcript_142558:1-678(-)
MPVVPHVDVDLRAHHALRNAGFAEAVPQPQLGLRETPGRDDEHPVEVAKSHPRHVGLQREVRSAGTREVPQADAVLAWEGVHRDLHRRLVDAHRSPAVHPVAQTSELVDQQGLPDARVPDDTDVHGAVRLRQPWRRRVVPPLRGVRAATLARLLQRPLLGLDLGLPARQGLPARPTVPRALPLQRQLLPEAPHELRQLPQPRPLVRRAAQRRVRWPGPALLELES